MKKKILLIAVLLICCLMLCSCGKKTEISDECRDFINNSLTERFDDELPENGYECAATEIMLARESGNNITVYAWVLHEIFSYNEEGISLFSVSYTPAAITVRNENGRYSIAGYAEPREGTYYKSDVRNIFPVSLWRSILEENGESSAKKLEESCSRSAEEYYEELEASGGLSAVTFEDFDPDEAVPFGPEDITNIRRAEIHESFGDFAVSDEKSCALIEKLFSEAETLRGATNCPFDVKIYLFREDGTVGYVRHAQDGCMIIHSKSSYYKYSASGSEEIWNLFGIIPAKTEQELSPSGQLICQTEYFWYEPVSKAEFEYDKAGNLIRKTMSSPEEGVGSVIEYVYDENGFLKEEKTFLPSENGLSLSGTALYTYDEEGRCIKNERLDANGKSLRVFEYEFDENGNLIRTTYDNGSYDINKYDAFGNLIDISSYTKYGSRRRHTELRYEDGNLVKKIHYDGYGEVESYEVFEYDEDGNLISTESFAG